MALAALRHVTGIRTAVQLRAHDSEPTTPFLEA